MNWSKGFLIFSLFVLGAALIFFLVTSYQLRNVAEPEVTAEPNEEQATEGSGIGKQNVFSEAADQTSEEHVAVESEDDAETADDTLVDLIADSLTDDTELQETSETLSPEVKLKVERYAALAKLLPVIEELRHEKFLSTSPVTSNF